MTHPELLEGELVSRGSRPEALPFKSNGNGAIPSNAPAGDEPRVFQGMRLLEARVYRGPNPYGYRPVVRVKLDLGALENFPTTTLDGFVDRLLSLVPSLETHGCSYGDK